MIKFFQHMKNQNLIFWLLVYLIIFPRGAFCRDNSSDIKVLPDQKEKIMTTRLGSTTSRTKVEGSIFMNEFKGVSAGFHRWLGKIGTHYGDCVGAILQVAVKDPWAHNHVFLGAVLATAVGQYGDPTAKHIFDAAASTSEYAKSNRNYGGTVALPPLEFSYSSLAARADYRLRTESVFSASSYVDVGYGLLGTQDDAQIHGFITFGASLVVKLFPSLIITIGLQHKQDIASNNRIEGFEDMSALAIYNSFELVKF